MDGEERQRPWEDYRRARLPAELTYVLGRDAIEAALVRAGARVRTLSLSRPDLPLRGESHRVFDVYYYGDAHPGSFSAAAPRQQLLLMRWSALPVALATAVRGQVTKTWLDQGCAWAADALAAGNTWAAGEHRWLLTVEHGALRAMHT